VPETDRRRALRLALRSRRPDRCLVVALGQTDLGAPIGTLRL
jgi:hypothetical protein